MSSKIQTVTKTAFETKLGGGLKANKLSYLQSEFLNPIHDVIIKINQKISTKVEGLNEADKIKLCTKISDNSNFLNISLKYKQLIDEYLKKPNVIPIMDKQYYKTKYEDFKTWFDTEYYGSDLLPPFEQWLADICKTPAVVTEPVAKPVLEVDSFTQDSHNIAISESGGVYNLSAKNKYVTIAAIER